MELTSALAAFDALSQPTRLAAFRKLVTAGSEGMAAGEIARALSTPANTMSVHLGILTRAGLVVSRREGRVIRYQADVEAVNRLIGFLMADCCGGRPEVCGPVAEMAAKAAKGRCSR